MIAQSAPAALWLLAGATPIALYAALSDLRSMRIPNATVLALIAVYVVIGLMVFPFSVWAWSWLHFAVALVIGFVLSMTGGFGAGDAKFAAAMAPFIALADLKLFLVLLAAVALAALVAHRVLGLIPAIRRATPHWESWERKEFPFGLALGPALIFYLALAAKFGN